MKSKLVLAVCLICLGVLQYAQAAPDLNLRVDTGAAGVYQFEESRLTGSAASAPNLVNHEQTSSSTSATYFAEGTARGQAGSVGVWSYASVDGLVDGSAQYAETRSSAEYRDKIHFFGTGNVTLRIDAEVLFDLNGSANPTAPGMGGSGSAFASGGIAAFSQWYWGGSNLKEWAICNGVFGCGSYSWVGEAVPEGLHAYSFEITIPTTTTLEILTRLNSEATAGLYNNLTGQLNGGTASWTTSALNSLRNGVTILTPGVTLSSDSGFDYVFVPHATSVPEPATFALLGLGLAGLGFSRRK